VRIRCALTLALLVLALAPLPVAAEGSVCLPIVQTCAIARARAPIAWGQVSHTVDGDTIDVKLDGCPLEYVRIRLIGVDTAERGQCYYAEAKAYTAQLEGQRVGLERDSSEWDSFGRLLRHVYTGSGRWHNGELVALGYARVCTVAPDCAYSGRLQAFEDAARAGNLGAWGACGW